MIFMRRLYSCCHSHVSFSGQGCTCLSDKDLLEQWFYVLLNCHSSVALLQTWKCRILTTVCEMSGILLKVWEVSGKSGKELFIVSCIFASVKTETCTICTRMTQSLSLCQIPQLVFYPVSGSIMILWLRI